MSAREERAERSADLAPSGAVASVALASGVVTAGLFGLPQAASAVGGRALTAPGAAVDGALEASTRTTPGRSAGIALAPFVDAEGRVDGALVGRDDVRVSVRSFEAFEGLGRTSVLGAGSAHALEGLVAGSAGRSAPVAAGAPDMGVMAVVPHPVPAALGAPEQRAGLVATSLRGLEASVRERADVLGAQDVTGEAAADRASSRAVDGAPVAEAPVAEAAAPRTSDKGSDATASGEGGPRDDVERMVAEVASDEVQVAPSSSREVVTRVAEAPPQAAVADPTARQEHVDRALDAVTLPSRLALDVADRDGVWSLEIGRHHAGLEVLLRGDREFVGAVRGVEHDVRETLRASGGVARVAVEVDTSAGRGSDLTRDQGRGGAWTPQEAPVVSRASRSASTVSADVSARSDSERGGAVRGGVTVSRLA